MQPPFVIVLHSTRKYLNTRYMIIKDLIFRDPTLIGANVNSIVYVRTYAMLLLPRAEALKTRGSGALQWHY
jgi:hypothetical protein